MNRLVPVAAATTLLLTLSACGGASTDTTTSDPTVATAGGQPQGQGDGALSGAMGGASGQIAAVDGRTLQVQSDTSGQVAVTYTGTTALTEQVSADPRDIAVGDCVAVGSADATSAGSPVAAATVRITTASRGSCSTGFGGAGGPMPSGGPPSGMPTDVPSGTPSGMPSGLPQDGGAAGRGGTFGKVTALAADGFTVEQTASPDPGATSASGATEVTVTVSADTTVTATAATTATALKVGRCVIATGDSDSTGAVTATSIMVSDKVDGACALGGPAGAAPAGSR